jgi:outer membrane receptor protein involved in Fe transport
LTHVRQEELTSYELGLKQSLLNRSLQLNASAFYYDYDNKQINADVPAVIFGQVERLLNIPKSRVFGIDGDLTFRPVSRLTLRSAFTYLDTRITQVDPGAFTLTDYRNNAFPDTAIVGARFPYAPQWNVTAGGDYDWYTTDSWSAFAGADLLWNSRTSSSLLTRVTNCVDCTLATIRAFTTLDLRAGLRSADDKWSFYMWGRNVTDKYYWTATAHISDTVVRYTGQPATYGATLRYSF